MDKEKAEAYQIIGDMGCKAFIVLVICIAWLVMVGFLIYNPSYPLGIATVGTPLSMMWLLGNHYFPKRKR